MWTRLTYKGFTLKNKHYLDRNLSVGASSSCNIFGKISENLVYILLKNCAVENVVKVMENFMLIKPTESLCTLALEAYTVYPSQNCLVSYSMLR